MFKVCFSNFLRNLKYIFVELGFMYLALMLGFDLFVKKVGIGFKEFAEAFQKMMEQEDLSLVEEGAQQILSRFAEGAMGFFVIQLLGIVLGFFFILIMVRSDVERKNIFKVIISAIVDTIILAILIIVMGLLLRVGSWGPILVLLLFLPIYSFGTLFGSYINHGLKKVDFKKAVSFRNIFKLSIYNFIIILLTIALGALCLLIFNVLVGAIMIMALFMVGISTISLNADSYVNELAINAKIEKKVEQAKEEVVKDVIEEEAK